jgi:hypothetical protein
VTGYHPEDASRPDYDDAELDALLATAMDGMLGKLEAGFDPGAGLADVYARAGADPLAAARAPAPARRRPGPAATSRRLQEACDQIDTLDAFLAAITRSTRNDPFAGAAFVEAARPVLLQLRMGLANRTLAREDATRLIGHVRHNLDEAERILQAQGASSLAEIARTRLGSDTEFGGSAAEQAQALAQVIMRLYEDAGYTVSLEPSR